MLGKKYVFCSHSLRTTQQAIIQSTMNGDIFILAKNITLLMQMVDNDVCVLILLDDDFVLNMQLMTVWSLNACFYSFAWSSWWLKISIQTFCFYIKKNRTWLQWISNEIAFACASPWVVISKKKLLQVKSIKMNLYRTDWNKRALKLH